MNVIFATEVWEEVEEARGYYENEVVLTSATAGPVLIKPSFPPSEEGMNGTILSGLPE